MKGSGATRAIRVAQLNIRLVRAGGPEAALRELKQGNFDVGVFQETKLTKGIHTRYVEGYVVWYKEV